MTHEFRMTRRFQVCTTIRSDAGPEILKSDVMGSSTYESDYLRPRADQWGVGEFRSLSGWGRSSALDSGSSGVPRSSIQLLQLQSCRSLSTQAYRDRILQSIEIRGDSRIPARVSSQRASGNINPSVCMVPRLVKIPLYAYNWRSHPEARSI